MKSDRKKPQQTDDTEPNAPSIAKMPAQMNIPKDIELEDEDITKAEGYQDALKLMNLAFNRKDDELKKIALEHGDTLGQGLAFLKSKGYDYFMNIQNMVGKDKEIDSQILEDFDRNLTENIEEDENEESIPIADLYK